MPAPVINSGDALAVLEGFGEAAADFSATSRGSIKVLAAEAHSDVANGTEIKLVTTKNATVAPLERLIVTHEGKLGLGTVGSYAFGAGDFVRLDREASGANESTAIVLNHYKNGQVTIASLLGRTARNTKADPRRTLSTDTVMRIGGSGYQAVDDATTATLVTAARAAIDFVATQDWTSAAQGSKINLLTTAVGSTTLTQRLGVDEAGLTLADGLNLVTGTATGMKIGTGATQKLAFWNATPIVQPAAITQTYSTASRTHAALTSATLDATLVAGTANTAYEALAGVTYGTDVAQIRNNFADVAAQCNALRVDLENAKQLINSLIDDHRAMGLCA